MPLQKAADASPAIEIKGNIIARRGGVAWDLSLDHSVSRHRPSWNQRRSNALKALQAVCKEEADRHHGKLTSSSFVDIFSRPDVLELLFQLFDPSNRGQIRQDSFVTFLRGKFSVDQWQTYVDLVETVAYVIADENDLNRELFVRMWTSRGVLPKLFAFIDDGRCGHVTTNSLMNFVTQLTYVRRNAVLTKEELRKVEEIFRQRMNPEKRILLEDFRKMIPAKNPFFAERVFEIFDKDGSGGISFSEFMESVEEYCSKSINDKVRFIFQVYDINGDGLIRVHELKSVLRACMEENGMKFSEEQLTELTEALYEDANPEGSDGITFEQLKTQLIKHEGLLESLSINIDRWLLPTESQPPKSRIPYKLTMPYIKNNSVLLTFLALYFATNVALFVTHALEYINDSVLYMLARGAGQTLNFNGMFILVLMLRRVITFLRVNGFSHFLPLDQHIYLHQVCGTVLVFLVLFHTAMHTSNFVFNVADQLVINNRTYSAVTWLFTMEPGQYGLIPGIANLTGWAMLLIILIMALCSLPFVRRGGNFEVFYWTHLLCIPFWILMLLHEKHFWYWLLVPGIFFLLELLTRCVHRFTGHGQTYISSAILLPSRVTHLLIKRPKQFDFRPGDYVFVNIPAIASSEWHPFTISSAPEQPDTISLHIRGVGGWTNKLYDYFERQTQLARISVSRADTFTSGDSSKSKSPATSTPKLTPSPPPESFRLLLEKSYSCPGNDGSEGFQLRRRRCYTTSEHQRPDLPRSYSHNRNLPPIITVCVPPEDDLPPPLTPVHTPRLFFAPETLHRFPSVEGPIHSPKKTDSRHRLSRIDEDDRDQISVEEPPTCKPLKVVIDGPYGAPSSHIFHAEHAVLIAAGIGVTPFASILQSIMHRYWNSRQNCPNCRYSWNASVPETIKSLRKVDFFWINREQRSFEWFINLLTQLEIEQAEKGGLMDRFLDMHMYITSGLQRTDVKALGLHLALDLLYNKDKRDLVTGLKTRTRAGRPNWDKVFQQLQDQQKGRISVFFCGPPQLGAELSKKCAHFGFYFHEESF